jgi:chromate transporter
MAKLFELFMIFFKIGAFTIGGGYAMVPLIQDEICSKKKWSTDKEFIDIIAIAQSLPGVLAVNTASIVGYKLFGIPGVIAASLGAVLPSFLIILVIAMFFVEFAKYKITESIFRGVRPAVVALIAYSVIKLGKNIGFSYFNLIIAALALILILSGAHPIIVVIAAGIVGVAAGHFGWFKGGKKDAEDNN